MAPTRGALQHPGGGSLRLTRRRLVSIIVGVSLVLFAAVWAMGRGLANTEVETKRPRTEAPRAPTPRPTAALLVTEASDHNLPPGANWSETEARSVPYRVTKMVKTTPLSDAEKAAFMERMRKSGYSDNTVIALPSSTAWPTLKKIPVINELLLSACDVQPPAFKPDCDSVRRVREEVGLLDQRLLADPAMVKGLQVKKNRPRPGQGLTGRGWGISGPFTNKWRFYESHLRAVFDDARRKEAGGSSGLHHCEVGFLAGHSTSVFTGILGRDNFASLTIIDYPQGGLPYARVGSSHMRSRFDPKKTRFDFLAGASSDGLPAAIRSGRLTQCDYISLDGSKLVHDVLLDFRNLAFVARPWTVAVCDDIWTTLVLQTVNKVEKLGLKALDVRDGNVVLAALVSMGALQIHEVWHSDVDGWPQYGNLAFKFKLFGNDFARVADFLMAKYDASRVEPMPTTLNVTCGAATALGLPAGCCDEEGKTEAPVSSILSTVTPRLDRRWGGITKAVESCAAEASPKAADVDAAAPNTRRRTLTEMDDAEVVAQAKANKTTQAEICAPRLPLPILNAWGHAAHTFAWASELRGHPRDSDVLCTFGMDPTSAAHALSIARAFGGASFRRLHAYVLQQPGGDSDAAKPSSMTACGAKVEVKPIANGTRFALAESCRLALLDVGGVLREHDVAARAVLAALRRVNEFPIVLHNVNAAGIAAGQLTEIHHSFGGVMNPEGAKRLAFFSSQLPAPLTGVETDVLHGLVVGKLYRLRSELPSDPALATGGTMVVSTRVFLPGSSK